jgi:predicted DNA-binding transcriptional regulator AlpA
MAPPEVTGRKPWATGNITSHPPSTGPPPRLAYSISEFCLAVGISRFTYYKMKKAGTGPREMRIGDRGFISVEAAREWCERHTQPAIA